MKSIFTKIIFYSSLIMSTGPVYSQSDTAKLNHYEAVKGLHIFISGKNILNNRSREFYRSDEVFFRLMAGVNYEF